MASALRIGYCSCVTYAKAVTGFSTPIGAARNWPLNATEPQIGAVVITSESAPNTSTGHVAIIKDIQNGHLILSEANYAPCKLTHGRVLPISSPLIMGYWSPN